MGEFLSTANKNKISEDNESKTVRNKIVTNRLDMERVECKDGENAWKILTFQI